MTGRMEPGEVVNGPNSAARVPASCVLCERPRRHSWSSCSPQQNLPQFKHRSRILLAVGSHSRFEVPAVGEVIAVQHTQPCALGGLPVGYLHLFVGHFRNKDRQHVLLIVPP